MHMPMALVLFDGDGKELIYCINMDVTELCIL